MGRNYFVKPLTRVQAYGYGLQEDKNKYMGDLMMSESVEQEVVSGVEEEVEVGVAAELIIRVFTNGNTEVNVPEGGTQLQAFEVEAITRSVHEQLRDTRIANQAVAMFKSKLG